MENTNYAQETAHSTSGHGKKELFHSIRHHGGQPVSDSTPAKLRSDQQTTPASSLAHAEPATRQGALTVTIHGYQTRYQPRKSKAVDARDPKRLFEKRRHWNFASEHVE